MRQERKMNKRQLGESDFEIGEIGLGCWQFGGDFGEMKEETAFAIMQTAVANGIDFFDTANVYGAGRSEALIGQFLKQSKRPVIVATKFGREQEVYPDRYSEGQLRRSIHDSAQRLRVDSIDLLQLHCIPTSVLQSGEVFDWLRRAKADGLIKQFGASVETVEEGMICMEQEGLQSLQVIFNIFRQKPAHGLLPEAKKKGVGIIVRLPLASGLLTGKFTRTTTFSPGDHRNYNRNGNHFNIGETFAGIPFEKGVELTEEISKFRPEGMSMAQFALRWILDHEAVSVVIPGASSPEQASANAKAADLRPLSPPVHEALEKMYTEKVHSLIRGPY